MQEYSTGTPIKSNEICTLTMVRRVAAMLDLDASSFSDSGILPKGWHFFMLAGQTQKSELRKDGFPGLGVPMPDLEHLPRLLLGGRTVRYQDKIVIGEAVEKISFVKSITEKSSATGRMAIVTLQHELRPISAQNPAIVETQTYILLEEQKKQSQTKTTHEEQLIADVHVINEKNVRQIIPDETLLFQYSALGFNSHKIHLDRDYTQNVEGLPDLVVNGGLATLLLTEFLQNQIGIDLKEIKAKHLTPLYCNRPLKLVYENDEAKIYDDNNNIAVVVEIK
jgi:3-methylfumaryl-CoA hydratase